MPPAARLGDPTVHGGVITLGAMNVLIGGQPAARMGDMHTCPMCNGPVPHVGGPIILGSMTVLIGGQPAARMNDQCVCTGPPDSIIMGCMTVLIGDGGGGGAPGSGGGGDAQVSSEAAEEAENHFIDVSVVDKGGLPVTGIQYSLEDPDGRVTHGTVTGKISKQGVSEGDYELTLKAITSAKWSAESARTGEEVKLQIESAGIDPGAAVVFEIWQKDINRADRKIYEINDIDLQGNKAEATWMYQFADTAGDRRQAARGYSSPSFYFIVTVERCRARSGLLRYKDYFEIELLDEDGNGVGSQDYVFYLPSGDVRRGTLDGNGYKKEENVPPGQCRVEFPGRPQTDTSI